MSQLSRDRVNVLEDLAYRSKNPRQALKTLEKWMKKDAKNPYMQCMKGRILLECGEGEKALAIGVELAKDAPVPLDVNFLRDVHSLVSQCQLHLGLLGPTVGADVTKMWQSAIKNQKASQRCALECISVAVQYDQWEDVQMAISQMRRLEPNNSTHYFLSAVSTQIAAERLELTDPKKSSLLQTLTFRMLDVAAKSSSPQPDSKNTIDTSTALDLTTRIYQNQGQFSELLTLLDNTYIGLDSAIGAAIRPKLVKARLHALMKLERWQEIFAFCESCMRGDSHCAPLPLYTSRGCSDWDVFEYLLRATENLDFTETDKCNDIIKEYQKRHSTSTCVRNSTLALTKLQSLRLSRDIRANGPSSALESASNSMLDACARYFETFGSHVCCFGDLKPIVEDFTSDQHTSWKSRVESIVDQSHTVNQEPSGDGGARQVLNKAKFDYLSILAAENGTGSKIERLGQLVMDYSRLLEPPIPQVSSEAALFMAVALIKIHALNQADGLEDSTVYLLEAIILLRKFAAEDGENRTMSLLLVRLYLLIGAGSLAVQEYKKLSIKGVLHDNFAHVIITRIATMYPLLAMAEASEQEEDEKDNQGLEDITTDPLVFYRKSTETTDLMIVDGVKKGAFCLFMELAQLKAGLGKSFTRQLLVLERRRFLRLLRRHSASELESFDTGMSDPSFYFHSEDADDEVKEFHLSGYADKRDTHTIPDVAPSSEATLDSEISTGPKPQKYWLATQLLIDDTVAMLGDVRRPRDIDTKAAQEIVDQASTDDEAELTEAERLAWRRWRDLRALVEKLDKSPALERLSTLNKASSEIVLSLDKISSDVKSLLKPGGKFPLASNLQTFILNLELLQAYAKLCDGVVAQTKPRRPDSGDKKHGAEYDSIVKSLNAAWEGVRGLLKQKKKELGVVDLSSPLGTLRRQSTSLGKTIDIVGEGFAAEVTRSCVKSGQNALEGILSIALH